MLVYNLVCGDYSFAWAWPLRSAYSASGCKVIVRFGARVSSLASATMISPTRRSAIPVSTSGTRRLMSRSLSRDTLTCSKFGASARARQPATSITESDLHNFTLLEENIALKEANELQHRKLAVMQTQLTEAIRKSESLQQRTNALEAQLNTAEADRQRLQDVAASLQQRIGEQDRLHVSKDWLESVDSHFDTLLRKRNARITQYVR